jgi:hypothetical protein
MQNSQGAAAGSAGIAAALQNVLQAGQSSSMQQVILISQFFHLTFFVLCIIFYLIEKTLSLSFSFSLSLTHSHTTRIIYFLSFLSGFNKFSSGIPYFTVS